MRALISAALTTAAAASLLLAATGSATAQNADTPWPPQMGQQWMMVPMGPQGASPGGQQGWMMWGPQSSMRGGMGGAFYRFRIVDADSDGLISDAEAASNHEEVFVAMDADEDGALTEQEYLSVSFGPGPMGWGPNRTQAQERKEAMFDSMDSDGDGSVDQGEWMSAGQERFAATDQDEDGVVTVWEFRSIRRF